MKLKASDYLLNEKNKITFSVFHTITVFFIFSLIISLSINLLAHHPVRDHLIYAVSLLFLSLSLFIIKHINVNLGTTIYIVVSFSLISILDYFALLEAHSAPVLYSFPMTMCFLFIRNPQRYVFLGIFSAVIALRIIILTNYELQVKAGYILLMLCIVFAFAFLYTFISKIKGLQIRSLKKINNTTIRVLGRISELRDSETEGHLKRVESSIGILAESLMGHKKYTGYITAGYIEDLKAAAYLHDIGKVGISDSILLKPDRLTPEEFGEMKKHTIIGYELLQDAIRDIEHESLYDLALRITRHHHERWDGTGYPDNLKGEEIPLCSRLMALVDVYDALISPRPYKAPYPHEEALDVIRNGAGTHFDPLLVEHFIGKSEEINLISEKFREKKGREDSLRRL